MQLTEHQEQIIGRAVKEAFIYSPVKPPEGVVQELAVLIKDYLVKHL